jgi:hypothetical protein
MSLSVGLMIDLLATIDAPGGEPPGDLLLVAMIHLARSSLPRRMPT